MGLRGWLKEFKELHEHARIGVLSGGRLEEYVKAREELARTILATQRLDAKPGHTARQSVRAQRSMPIDITIGSATQQVATLNISEGGFAGILNIDPPPGKPAAVVLHMPDTGGPLTARALVVASKRYGASFYVSFSFDGLSQSDVARLGFLVFDTVLEALHM